MKKLALAFFIGIMILTSCRQNINDSSDDGIFEAVEILEGGKSFYIDEAVKLTKEAGELAKSDEYIALYTGDDEVSAEIKSVADIDFENPAEIQYIHFDIDKAVEFVEKLYKESGEQQEIDFRKVIELNRFNIQQFASMINARYGAKTLAATTVLAKSRGYIKPKDFEKNFAVYLKYDGSFSSVVSFSDYGDGVISANMTFVKNGEETIDALLTEIIENLGEESVSVETVAREN